MSNLRTFERPPMRQYLLATTPGGRVHRWGEDELSAADVTEDLTDSDSVPGGEKQLSCSLPRKPGTDYSDMQRGTRVDLYGAGNVLLRSFRLERAPRTSGDYLTMDPAAMGYQVLLTDKEEAREIFIDSDMSGWGEPSGGLRAKETGQQINVNAQVQLLPAGGPEETPSPAAIAQAWSRLETTALSDIAESWYESGGIELGRLLLDFMPVAGMGGAWVQAADALSDSLYNSFERLKNFASTAAEHAELVIAAGRYFLDLVSYFSESFSGTGKWEVQWRNLKVLGRHGLRLYGTWPQVGLVASDIIAYSLARWAPGVHFTTGPYGSIKASSFAIPHLVFKEPTTVQEIITQALKYELLEWSVRGTRQGPTFFLNPRGEREGRTRWRARIRPAKFTETGQQMDQVWNRCVVSFNGFDGKQHTVGPEDSGMEFPDARCEDRDPLNPINEAGEDRTKHIALNDIATPEGAAETAQRFLEQCKLLDGSGEATLTGYVEDEHGAEWPYDRVQAGDLIDFIDSSIPGYHYIVEATRTRSDRAVKITIDAPPDSYEALLEQLGARETGAGLGS